MPFRSSSNNLHIAFGALTAGAVAIGFSPIFVRLSLIGPTATAFYRVALAIPALWLVIAKSGSAPARQLGSTRQLWPVLAASGFFLAVDLTLWHWSLQHTTVANATLLANMAPIFSTLGAWMLFHERIRIGFLIGLVVALAGAAILMGKSFDIKAEQLRGDLLALTAAIFYAAYLLSVRHLRRHLDTGPLMLGNTIACALCLVPLTIGFNESFWVPTALGWLVLLGLALVSQVMGQGFVAFALAHLPTGLASVTLLLQPVVAAFFAWMLFAESLSAMQMLGGMTVLVGIYLCRRYI